MNLIILAITGILGATLTYYVSEELNQGAVRASAVLALIVGLFFYWFPNVLSSYLTNTIPIVFIGTSFIGMASPKGSKNYLLLAIACVFFSVIYVNKSHFFNGYGGALGTLAFITLIATMACFNWYANKTKITQRIVLIKNKIFNRNN